MKRDSTMNTMIKGSIAGATGIALLMGGFGTYALWSDSENLVANGVQSGELDIATSAGVYDDANSAAANDWTATDKMVPGDKVTYTQTFTVKGSGKNLKGTIAYVKPALTTNFAGLDPHRRHHLRQRPTSRPEHGGHLHLRPALRHRDADGHGDLHPAGRHGRPGRPGQDRHAAGRRVHHHPGLIATHPAHVVPNPAPRRRGRRPPRRGRRHRGDACVVDEPGESARRRRHLGVHGALERRRPRPPSRSSVARPRPRG